MNEADFVRAIDHDPSDETLQRIYADWLEENGDPRGEAWRVLVEHKFRPKKSLSQTDQWSPQFDHPGPGLWYWDWASLPDTSDKLQISASERCKGVRRSFFLMMDDAAISWVRAFRDENYQQPGTES